MESAIEILRLCDIIIVMWALRRLYHSLFHVIYIGIGSYVKELGGIFLIAAFIVALIPGRFSPTGQLIYYIAFLVVALAIIFRPTKTGKKTSDS